MIVFNYNKSFVNYVTTLNFLLHEARLTKTPVYKLEELSNHKNSQIRITVASNSSTPINILEKMCFDDEEEVREGIQYNRNGFLEKLKQAEMDLYFMIEFT